MFPPPAATAPHHSWSREPQVLPHHLMQGVSNQNLIDITGMTFVLQQWQQ